MEQHTNAEKRVIAYQGDTAPTTACTATPETSLEALNLNWRERDLPERERTKHVHRLHPYLGKYIPQLVEIFLRKYFQPGQTILDPFAGSSTTLVQANELGINSIGCDISAFNVLLGQAKTASYDLSKMEAEVRDILAKTLKARRPKDMLPSLLNEVWDDEAPMPVSDSQYLRDWFAPQALEELLTYRHYIVTGGYEYTDLLKIILSRSARSARLTTHFDLDFPKKPQREPYHCYKHSRICQPTTDAAKFLERYSLDTIKRVREFAALRTGASVTIHHADSRGVEIPPIDGLITSPPYVGLIDYHEQHVYAYHLLGLEDKRSFEIGAAASGSSLKAKTQYQQDIASVFQRALDAMPSGARMVVVAGDWHDLYGDIAGMIGVEVEAIVQRHVNRRTGRRASDFFESVFIWSKP